MSQVPGVSTRSAAETRRLAGAVAEVCQAGDLIALIGPLGCGKTCFASGFVAALPGGRQIRVTSPTFTTINTYDTAPPVYHLDLYRLQNSAAIELLGYEEYYDGDGVCLVEWFDRAPEGAPQDYLEIHFLLRSGTRRRLELHPSGPRGQRLAFAALRSRSRS